MLHLHAADRALPLAERLAAVLAEVPADPLEPEWIAVPTLGMGRWLSLELARRLGAAGPGSGDGVAANLTYAFPGTLRTSVLAAGRPEVDGDPWSVERLAWPILEVLASQPAAGAGHPSPDVPAFARARRIADLFDRYHVHRPDMVRAWAAGRDVDGIGAPLAAHHRWQPELWRTARRHIGVASPPEALPGILAGLAAGTLAIPDLPSRLSLFGFPVLPGGQSFLDLVQAVAVSRDVHLCLLDPSPATSRRVRERTRVGAIEDPPAEVVTHPLLRSWGRLPRETAVLLAGAGIPPASWCPSPEEPAAPTLLERLQSDLRAGRAPSGGHALQPGDRTIQFHATHGPARQVEVLRDAVLHLLEADPSLREEDILVACPRVERFTTLIESAFGPSAGRPGPPAGGAPPLRYRVADRSIRGANTVIAGLATILDAVTGRFDAPTTLDLLALPALRRRYRFDDDDLARIGTWTSALNIRWGLDAAGREPFGVPASLATNTWQAGLDRLLIGIAVADDELAFSVGGVVPLGVEGDEADLVGRLADVMARLGGLADATAQARPVAEWIALLAELATAVLAPAPADAWHAEVLAKVLVDVVAEAGAEGKPSEVPLTFADLRRLLAPRLVSAPGRPDFFRGGITFTSLESLRWVPHRVVCLLGMDQAAFATGSVDGDDLAAASPQIGDRDPRGEGRQAVLEAVLAAGSHLVVVREGHDLRTNQVIPPAVVVAELQDAVAATVLPGTFAEGDQPIEVAHPRQAFDDRCFVPAALVGSGPWSFDPRARAGAAARRSRTRHREPFLAAPLAGTREEVIDLSDLHATIAHPIKAFLDARLQIRLPFTEEAPATRLPVEVVELEQWKIGDRLLHATQDGADLHDQLAMEAALGALPPGTLGTAKARELDERVAGLLAAADSLGVRRGRPDLHPIDVILPDGTRVVGTVSGRLGGPDHGPARIGFGRIKAKYHLAAWLDLLALTAQDPTGSWRSVVVNHDTRGPVTRDLVVAGTSAAERAAAAADGLTLAADLLRRSRTEALPIFPTLTEALFLGKAAPSCWVGFKFPADREDRHVAVAYGDLDYDDVLAIPAEPHDPPGPGGRAERYAHHLWGTVNETSLDLASIDADRDRAST
ncbi:MAG: exodeoxyribonuclease gamma subunit [Acidimicrobiales bacterium]|nr:exodeoxyribonuclease gamma subunit [Acidimicrobiales bacterium]